MTRYRLTVSTGAVGAALGQNSSVFVMRLDPSAAVRAKILAATLDWAVSTAFTTVTVAGRRLSFYRGAGADASGGTQITTIAKQHADDPASQFADAEGGEIRVATTAALTVSGITFEADELASMFVAGHGALNDDKREEFAFKNLILKPGDCLAVRNPVAMDAAGVWNLGVQVEWEEFATSGVRIPELEG